MLERRFFSGTRVLNENGSGDGVRPGLHKSPITDKLWSLRNQVLAERNAKLKAGTELGQSGDGLIPQIPLESKVAYEFSKDKELQSRYNNPWGTIRIGRVIEDLDALAGNIAFKHASAGSGGDDMMLVTASIDRICLDHRANLKDDIVLSGKVTYVGSSSMEIHMEACSTWTSEPWLGALFTFVARDRETGRARRINPLTPQTPAEITAFQLGEQRANQRKLSRKTTTDGIMLPKEYVSDSLVGFDQNIKKEQVSLQEMAEALFHKSSHRLLMPAIALKNAIQLSETELSNTQVMQPQQQNTAGRIFGGFLVRRAYELAFSTAYLFSGQVPRFREIDQCTFRKPVDVGDLVHFRSSVLFCSDILHENPSVHVEVKAQVCNPQDSFAEDSNSFNFSFEVPKGTDLCTVVPETLEDSLRIVQRYNDDLLQKHEDQEHKT